MARFNELSPPTSLETEDDRVRYRSLRRFLTLLLSGRVNWVGEFTVAITDTSTVVYDDRVKANSHISFTPQDVNAAGLVGAGIWIESQVESSIAGGVNVGNFTLHHAAAVGASVFRYSIKG